MFLTFITFLPILGALFLAFLPKENEGAIKQTALAIAAADFYCLYSYGQTLTFLAIECSLNTMFLG